MNITINYDKIEIFFGSTEYTIKQCWWKYDCQISLSVQEKDVIYEIWLKLCCGHVVWNDQFLNLECHEMIKRLSFSALSFVVSMTSAWLSTNPFERSLRIWGCCRNARQMMPLLVIMAGIIRPVWALPSQKVITSYREHFCWWKIMSVK